MPWVKRNLRGTLVFARTKPDGSLDVGPDGRVDVRYKADDGAKIYRAAERNLERIANESPSDGEAEARPVPRVAPPDGESVVIYTDGACSRNPGPMGIGVVILRGRARQEIGEYLGHGTNNIAELTAIERALDALGPADRSRRVLLHADSAYALGVVSGEMKPKKNLELVDRIRRKARAFPHLEFVKVRGHAGVAENERCDRLATSAVASAARPRAPG